MLQTLWLVLAYSYNILLVLFIAIHLFVGAIISFLMGMYIGVYLSQNYQIPRINEPKTLWEKFLTFLERNRREPHKISVANMLQPNTMKELVLEEEQSISREHEPSQECKTNNGFAKEEPVFGGEREEISTDAVDTSLDDIALNEEDAEIEIRVKDAAETSPTDFPTCPQGSFDVKNLILSDQREADDLKYPEISPGRGLNNDRASLLH